MRVKGKRVLKNGMEAGYVYYSKEKKWKWRIIGKAKKSKRVQKGGNYENEIEQLYEQLKVKLSENKSHGPFPFRSWKQILKKKRYNITSIEDILSDVNDIYNKLYRKRTGFIKDYTKKCWDSVMNGEYNYKTLNLSEKERKRCDILFLVMKIKKIEKEIEKAINNIDKLVFNITKFIDDNLKQKEKQNKGVIVINADKLARIKYYVIKNSAPNFYEILRELSKKQYYYLYDSLQYKHQYMALLQITQMKSNFKLTNISKDHTNNKNINDIVSNIKKYISENFADIEFLCNFLKIKCNKNNIEPGSATKSHDSVTELFNNNTNGSRTNN